MKIALSLIAAIASLSLATVSATADEVVTLMDPDDQIVLKPGQVALIVTTSERTVVQYKRIDKWPHRVRQLYLAPRETESLDINHYGFTSYGPRGGGFSFNSRGSNQAFYDRGADRFDQRSFIPSWSNPLALAGPAKIKMVANGVVTVRVTTPAAEK